MSSISKKQTRAAATMRGSAIVLPRLHFGYAACTLNPAGPSQNDWRSAGP